MRVVEYRDEEAGETVSMRGPLSVAPLLLCSLILMSCSSGSVWSVRDHPGNPGNGCWGSSPASVRIDDDGLIHLSLVRIGETWCQAEIRSSEPAVYGLHRFHVISRLDRLHPSVVLGLFLYADDEHEIDIEMSRSLAGGDNLGVYAVQPARRERVHKFPVALTGGYTTHEIDWREDRVRFASWHGHCETGPCGGWIAQWEYAGEGIPSVADRLSVRMNLWLKGSEHPAEPQDVVLRYVREPLPERP